MAPGCQARGLPLEVPGQAGHLDEQGALGLPSRQVEDASVDDGGSLKADDVAGAKLAKAVKIGSADVGDVRIAAHRSAGDTQDDELSAGDLDRSGRDRSRKPVGVWGQVEIRPGKTQPHAVAL